MTKKVILVWFRNDLRLHDNEILLEAVTKGCIVIPVYFFDPRYFSSNKFNRQNTGVLRAQFLRECVEQLKAKLQILGSDLLIYHAKPEDILPTLCAKYEVTEVFHHREIASRETLISEKVEEALWKDKINLRHFIGHTLYHKEDLPFPIKDIPDSFSVFKKKVEKESRVRQAEAAIQSLISHPHLESTQVPSLTELGYSPSQIAHQEAATNQLIGGEDHGLRMVQNTLDENYISYDDYSSVAPYLAHGALSLPVYYQRIKEALDRSKKKKYERLLYKLLWRDYFRFMLKKYPSIYFKNKTAQAEIVENSEKFEAWMTATTKEPFIDELLGEMLHTGNISFEKRQILAAYFVQEIKGNWLSGAAVFEEYLLDYSPASNYGYWAHTAGQGTSLKDNLVLSWQALAKKYYPGKIGLK